MIFMTWGSTEDVFVDPPTFEPLEECRRVLFDDFLLVLGAFLQGVEVFGGCFPMVFLCLLDDFWILFLGWFATVCPCVPKG